MKVFWHIIKSGTFPTRIRQNKWTEELTQGFISAGYGKERDGRGKKKLLKYDDATILAYMPDHGLVGIGQIVGDYHYVEQDSVHEHAHRRAVYWDDAVRSLSQAVSVAEIRGSRATPPRTLATKVDPAVVESLRRKLRAKAGLA